MNAIYRTTLKGGSYLAALCIWFKPCLCPGVCLENRTCAPVCQFCPDSVC